MEKIEFNMNVEKELEKVKLIAKDCLNNGQFLKAVIVPHEDEFHVFTHSGEGRLRDVFTTHEAACKWAGAYFMTASAMPSAKDNRRNKAPG